MEVKRVFIFGVFWCVLLSVASFNLEPRIPVIKFGSTGSYFGYSVAEHITIVNDKSTSWLLVGAPLDQNLQPNTTKSGALWKCPLTPAVRDCEQVITDGKKYMDSDTLFAPHPDEIKDGQWLGVSVKSQGLGQKVVVCAHRYVTKLNGDAQYGQGLCYTLNNTLHLADIWEPCRGKPVTEEHESYGFCQVGTSSELLSDNTLIIGSPGPYTWRGTVFIVDSNDDYMQRSEDTYMVAVEDNKAPVAKYSYLGMAVAGAEFFEKESPSFAAGAPRARDTGQVLVFSKRTLVDYGDPDANYLNVSHVVQGEQLGSSFGYEVAAADVNGDGKPDLLVGAPFYFSSDAGGAVYLYLNYDYSLRQDYDVKLTGKIESHFGIAIANAGDLNKDGCEDVAIGSPYEGNGVVYIYMGNRNQGLKTKPDQVIPAEALPRVIRSFGHSLSGGVDVDGNGYPDLLVGAYESAGVALIRTRPIIDIETEIRPTNVIKNIDPSKQGCEKDPTSTYTCFHFEACCIIKSLVDSQAATHRVNYVIEAETFKGGRKFSRVFFGSKPTSKKSNLIDQTIVLRKGVEHCQEHIVYLKNNTRDIQTPIKFSLSYSLVLPEPKYATVGVLPRIDEYPVLNATATTTFTATFLNDCGADGVCISDLIVTPTLQLPSAGGNQYSLRLGSEEEVRLSVTVDNAGESAYEGQLLVQHHHSLHFVAVNVSDKHVICSRYNKTIVTCMLDNPFKKQPAGSPPITMRFDAHAVEDTEKSLVFTVWANSTSKEKYPGKKPATVEALVIMNAELSIKGVARPEQVFYGGEVKGETAMTYFDDIGTRIMHTYQVFNEGPWKVTSVRVDISWPHQLAAAAAQGKWLLYLEEVPTVDVEGDRNSGECFISEGKINPLNIQVRPGTSDTLLENLEIDPFLKKPRSSYKERHNATVLRTYQSAADNRVRRRREAEDIVKAEALIDKDRKHSVNMNCHNKTAKCINIYCLIYRLGRMQAATINIKARLWNATLVADYPRVGHVDIESMAVIQTTEDNNIHQTRTNDDSASVSTVAYPDLKISEASEVPLWVIIVSVILGLIVLVLLIIALWKLGFFKRSRPDPTLSGNLEKNTHEASPFIVRENRNSLR